MINNKEPKTDHIMFSISSYIVISPISDIIKSLGHLNKDEKDMEQYLYRPY